MQTNKELEPELNLESDIQRGLSQVKLLFSNLSIDSVESVRTIYSADIVFQDPFTEVHGIDRLITYFSNHYSNVQNCQFDYGDSFTSGNQVHLSWTLTFRHPRLAGGQQIEVDGVSMLVFDADKIIYHRDYYDSSALLYEHIPVLGSAIRYLRNRFV